MWHTQCAYFNTHNVWPVHMPVIFSRRPRTQVFPDPAKLARATGSRAEPSMNRQAPEKVKPNMYFFLSHFLEQLVYTFISERERCSRQWLVLLQGAFVRSSIEEYWSGASDGVGKVCLLKYKSGIKSEGISSGFMELLFLERSMLRTALRRYCAGWCRVGGSLVRGLVWGLAVGCCLAEMGFDVGKFRSMLTDNIPREALLVLVAVMEAERLSEGGFELWSLDPVVPVGPSIVELEMMPLSTEKTFRRRCPGPEHRVPEEVEHWPVSSQATLNSVAIVTQPNKKEKTILSLTLRWLARRPGEKLLIADPLQATPSFIWPLVVTFPDPTHKRVFPRCPPPSFALRLWT